MTEDKKATGEDNSSDGVDPGAPVSELSELTTSPSRGFLERLWRKIDRRELSVDIVDFSRTTVVQFFVEYWNMLVSIFKPNEDDPGGK